MGMDGVEFHGGWMWGGGCGEVGVRRWIWGGECGEVDVGRWMWGGGCGEVDVGRWVWGGGMDHGTCFHTLTANFCAR